MKNKKNPPHTHMPILACIRNARRCSRYMVAAYFPRRKLWPNGEEVLLPGMVAFWDVVEGHVSGKPFS